MAKQKEHSPNSGKKEIFKTPLIEQSSAESQEAVLESKEKLQDLGPAEIQRVREKIEKTELDDSLKMQAAVHAQSIRSLDEEKKIKKLIDLAKVKGVVYAVNVAKKMDDPYVLDMLHDILAKEGYYKKFTQ